MPELLAYLGVGAVTGFFAGLLGIGGGTIIVTSLALMFAAHGFPADYLMHFAIGTSLAAIVAGSWASFRAHHRHGAVDWSLVRRMTPGLLVGVLAGALASPYLGNAFLKHFFLVIMALITVQVAFDVKPRGGRDLPGAFGLTAVGLAIGACASFFGGGAAAVGVPFLTYCRVTIHRAIGTVAAMGFPMSIAGALGYMAAGRDVADTPAWSVGFVYLPAFAGIAVTSMLLAPWGAKLAHRLKGPTLRRIFAVFLLAMGAKVAISV
jgi:uncharacterized protein